jgi:hypothetical protein
MRRQIRKRWWSLKVYSSVSISNWKYYSMKLCLWMHNLVPLI